MPQGTNGDESTVTRPFAGLTRHNEVSLEELPNVGGHGSSMRWWTADYFGQDGDADQSDIDIPEDGFNTIISNLPRATTVEAGWRNPFTDEWVSTSKHNALVDPDKVEAMKTAYGTQEEVNEAIEDMSIDGVLALADNLGIESDGPPSRDDIKAAITPGDAALYHIPTDDYEVINPAQSLRPLAEVLREEDYADSVFGEFRVARGGGRVSADIFFDGMHVTTPETAGRDAGGPGDAVADGGQGKPTVVGLEVGYDFFGDTAFRVRGMALRTSCMNAMRAVTDWEVVKHAGDVQERVDWKQMYADILEELDLKRDQLSQVIAEASEMDFDLTELPDDFADGHDNIRQAFYEYAGLPGYLAEKAAENLQSEAADPFRPTWWDLYNGATWAITHYARGDVMGGGSIDNYARVADDMLMNPAGFEEQVVNAYEADKEQREDATLAEEGGGSASIAQAFESVRDKKETYEERADEMRALASPEAGD